MCFNIASDVWTVSNVPAFAILRVVDQLTMIDLLFRDNENSKHAGRSNRDKKEEYEAQSSAELDD